MSRFPLAADDETTAEVAEILLEFRQQMGFAEAPNFIKVQAASLSVMKGTWGLVQNVLVNGCLPRSLKEMVFVAISMDRKCGYCEAAHLACCRLLGVDENTINQLVENVDGLMPERTRDVINFGRKCAHTPQCLVEEDFQRLRDHGLNHAELMELIAMAGLAVYANTMADATRVETDATFAS